MKRPYSHLSISPIDLKLRTTCSFKANSIMWNDFWTGFILMITQYSFIHRLKSWEQYRKQIAVINYWKYCWGGFTRINLNIIRKGGFCAQTQKLITHCICCPCENLGMEQVVNKTSSCPETSVWVLETLGQIFWKAPENSAYRNFYILNSHVSQTLLGCIFHES